jgi:short-subunit dehydrogenase
MTGGSTHAAAGEGSTCSETMLVTGASSGVGHELVWQSKRERDGQMVITLKRAVALKAWL